MPHYPKLSEKNYSANSRETLWVKSTSIAIKLHPNPTNTPKNGIANISLY